jgi:hypothetical protein
VVQSEPDRPDSDAPDELIVSVRTVAQAELDEIRLTWARSPE